MFILNINGVSHSWRGNGNKSKELSMIWPYLRLILWKFHVMVSNKIVFLMYPLTTLINFYLINIACQNFNQILSLFPLISHKIHSLSLFIYLLFWKRDSVILFPNGHIQEKEDTSPLSRRWIVISGFDRDTFS